ncbi:MAG: 6-phosphogluconolactonase [Gammaproteobacteria bacterium]|nr:6-phosphogluconolactonase [Gammaproteobacteria bacterium]
MSAQPAWEILADVGQIARRAVELISAAARCAVERRGAFRIVLAGGSTPQHCYRLLADTAQEWPAWQVFFGDERCLPETDPARNLHMARAQLLAHVPISATRIHCPAVELGCTAAAAAYAALIRPQLPFDLVLLGVGEDGHTASLFPGRPHALDALCEAVLDAPKSPPRRVSMGIAALRQTREVLVLASGAAKAPALARWLAQEPELPIFTVTRGLAGHVLVDREAAGGEPV